MINILEKVYGHLKDSRKSWKPSGNYASSAGHPCERFLVYSRLDYDKKSLPEVAKLLIFRDGNVHEQAIFDLLKESGFEIVEQQRPFDWKEIELTGRIDGRIRADGKLIPIEIKTMNPYDFPKVNTQEDIQNSDKYWVRGYLAQMMLYLLMSNEEAGIFIIKNKATGQLKQINIKLDYAYAESIVKKLERVNGFIRFNKYPDRIQDKSVCQFCEFKQVCLPDESSEAVNIESDNDLLMLLEEREALKESAQNYKEIDEQIKDSMKAKGAGEYLVCGKFQVRVTKYNTTGYDVPKEIKDQYKTQKEAIKTEITKL